MHRPFRHLLIVALLAAVCGLLAGAARATGTVERNLAYAVNNTATSDSQMLDLFLPESANFPTVVVVPGGIWTFADRRIAPFQEAAHMLQERGIGCALISHRISPLYKHPAHANDVAAAFAWVKAHIASRGGDPSRVFLMGHSSGGQLAGLVASEPKYLARHRLSCSDIRACILLCPPLDLYSPEYDDLSGSDLYTTQIIQAFGDERSVLRTISPMYLLHPKLPPMLLIVGDNDREAIKLQTKRYALALKKLRIEARVFEARNRTHAATFLELGQNDDTALPEIVEFIAKH
jgi:arylformamidase